MLRWVKGKNFGVHKSTTAHQLSPTAIRTHCSVGAHYIAHRGDSVLARSRGRGRDVRSSRFAVRTRKGTYSVESRVAAFRVTATRADLRNKITAPAIATDPYSISIIHHGTNHGRPSVRKCQT